MAEVLECFLLFCFVYLFASLHRAVFVVHVLLFELNIYIHISHVVICLVLKMNQILSIY